jgi:putative transposase
MTIDFKGAHYPKAVIVHAVFFYVRYAVSYRDLEEILAERGVAVDHATLNRWVVKYSLLIAANAQARKRPTAVSWRIEVAHMIRKQQFETMGQSAFKQFTALAG